MQLASLSEKLGPLELWQWGAIGTVGGFLLVTILGHGKKTVAPVTANPTAPPSQDSSGDIFGLGSAVGGGSAGGSYGTYTQSSTFQCADGSIVSDLSMCAGARPPVDPPPVHPPAGDALLAYWQARYQDAFTYCLSNAQKTGQTGKDDTCADWALTQVGPRPN